MVEIKDYITAELGADIPPQPNLTETENTSSPESVIENVVHTVPAPPERYIFTIEGFDYSASSNRLNLLVTRGDKTVECFISSLIAIVAEARDNSSSNWGKLIRFEDRDGVTKQIYLRNSEIATNGKAIVKTLVDEGLLISTDSRMVDALLYYLNMGLPMDEKRATCTDRIGWHDDVYLFPDNSYIGNAETRYVYTGAPISNHHATKGTLQEWRENVAAICKGNSLLILAICVSFASVLLRLLKIESGGYHLYGESSTGKSTSLYVGASVHGDPDSIIATWDTTSVGAQGKAKQCNDSLMILDELHQSNSKDAGKTSYTLFNGKEKLRGNIYGNARNTASWSLNCLSSGEISYASFIQEGGNKSRAGQAVRMLDISADLNPILGSFENIHGEEDSFAFAERIKKASLDYYGTPIRAFIEGLVGHFDQLESDYAIIKEEFFSYFVPDKSSGQVKRVATKFAVAALAGEIASKLGITGWSEEIHFNAAGECFDRWLEARGTNGQQEPEKAVEQARNYLLRYGMSRFIPVVPEAIGGFKHEYPDRLYNTNMAGFRATNTDGTYEYLVFSETYNSEICLGLNPKTVTGTLVDRGYLKVGTDGKPQVRHRLPGMDQIRVYHFTSAILSDAGEFVPADPETEEQ